MTDKLKGKVQQLDSRTLGFVTSQSNTSEFDSRRAKTVGRPDENNNESSLIKSLISAPLSLFRKKTPK